MDRIPGVLPGIPAVLPPAPIELAAELQLSEAAVEAAYRYLQTDQAWVQRTEVCECNHSRQTHESLPALEGWGGFTTSTRHHWYEAWAWCVDGCACPEYRARLRIVTVWVVGSSVDGRDVLLWDRETTWRCPVGDLLNQYNPQSSEVSSTRP